MEPNRGQPLAEVEGPRTETGKLKSEAAKRMAEARRFDNNATLGFYRLALAVFAATAAGTKAAESPGWL